VYLVVASVEGDGDLGQMKGLNWVPEYRVDVAVVQFDAALAGWRTGASKYDVDHPFFLLKGTR
jgi:hypothetical protein